MKQKNQQNKTESSNMELLFLELEQQITSCEVKRTIWKLLHDKKAFEKMLFKIIRLHRY